MDQLGFALAGLPSSYREALHLRYYEGLAPAQVAERLGLSAETVRTRLRRGLELLRRDVGKRLGVDETRLGVVLLPLLSTAGRDLASAGPWGSLGTILVMKKAIVTVATLLLIGAGAVWWVDGPRVEPAVASRGLTAPAPSQPRATGAAEAPESAPLTPARNAPARRRGAEVGPEVWAVAVESGLILALRYAGSGDPLPFYRFTLEVDGEKLPLCTDARGRQRLATATTRRLRDSASPVCLRLPGT